MSGLSPEAWAFAGLTVTNVAAVLGTYLKGRAERHRSAAKTNAAVEEVRALAEPTGNGYARRTSSALERIEAKVDRTERKVDGLGRDVLHHLQDHSRSDLDRRDDDPREKP